MTETRKSPSALPLQVRAATIDAGAADAEARTVDLVFTTGATVRRHRYEGWDTVVPFDETLVVSPAAVNLERMNAGAPVLESHSSWSTQSQVAVVERAWIDGKVGKATVRFPKAGIDAAADRMFGMVSDGIIKNVSVGYSIDKIRVIEPEKKGQVEEHIVERWTPHEVSFVTIPADPKAQAQMRAGAKTYPLTVETHKSPAAAIRSLAATAKLPEFGEQHVADGTSIEQFRGLLMNKLADDQGEHVVTTIQAEIGTERIAQRARALESALLNRTDASRYPLLPGAEEFRGLSLVNIARESLESTGVRTAGMAREEIVGRALTQRSGHLTASDFPIILGNVINTTLRAGYEAAGQTFRPLVREVTLPDFREHGRAQLSEGPALDRVNEHGEFKRGTLSEARETYKLATFGKIVAITRQAILNDDMSAFTRIPQLLAQQAAQLESDLVWAQLLGNPTMGDGKTLFHADHRNVATAAVSLTDASALAAISAGRAAMSKQTGLDGRMHLNIRPSFLIVPADQQTAAEQALGFQTARDSASAAPEAIRSLEIITEPRLDVGIDNPAVAPTPIAGSASRWFMAAAPAAIDTVELAYLEGQRGLYTEHREGFDVDGVEIKARLDVGAKVIDWRGLYRNG